MCVQFGAGHGGHVESQSQWRSLGVALSTRARLAHVAASRARLALRERASARARPCADLWTVLCLCPRGRSDPDAGRVERADRAVRCGADGARAGAPMRISRGPRGGTRHRPVVTVYYSRL